MQQRIEFRVKQTNEQANRTEPLSQSSRKIKRATLFLPYFFPQPSYNCMHALELNEDFILLYSSDKLRYAYLSDFFPLFSNWNTKSGKKIGCSKHFYQ